MRRTRWISILLLVAMLGSAAGCTALGVNAQSTALKASGTVSTDTIQVAAEIGGRIAEIKVDKGSEVKAGDVLFRLDDQLLQAQYSQAQAAVEVAQAALDVANTKVDSAQVTYDQAVQVARLQDFPTRSSAWGVKQPDQFKLPAWYFDQDEQIRSAQAEVDAAQKSLDSELSDLDKTLKDASSADFVAAEKRLGDAQLTFQVAQETLQQAQDAKADKTLTDQAQARLDAAQTALDAVQKTYDSMLNTTAATNVQETRARVAVARQRLINAQNTLNRLQTGDQSLQVNAAKAALDQAKAGVTQAKASLTQAQAALQLVKVQLDKTVVASPASGIVLSRPLNAGEIASPGAAVVEIGTLDKVTLTVYIPESQYGNIHLGQKASVTVDSFPGKTFEGTVSYISDQAEFTPRNVQTVESRSTTVYKIEISLPNSEHDLKPGMPADATF